MDNKTERITIETIVAAPVEKVWASWTEPRHIEKWNAASDDWHTTRAENDVRVGGTFLWRMEAKDGSVGFDFHGTYTDVETFKRLVYSLGDERQVEVSFEQNGDSTRVVESFVPENTHSVEMQRTGWQAILDNFKAYTERTEDI